MRKVKILQELEVNLRNLQMQLLFQFLVNARVIKGYTKVMSITQCNKIMAKFRLS